MELSRQQRAIVVGSLLGDACLERNGKCYRLRMEHCDAQKEYVQWKCTMFAGLVSKASPMEVNAFHQKQRRTYKSWRMYTRSSPLFREIEKQFYVGGRKIVPLDLRALLTDPLSLAVWFMDDGYKRNDCNAFRINTDSFTKKEQMLLQETLATNFGIDSSVHQKGKYWNIYIPQSSSRRFVKVVKPHILPCLLYKIALAP